MKSHDYISADEAAAADRQANCLDKLTWQSHEEAVAAAAYSAYQYGDGSDKPVPYQCKYCGKYHLSRYRFVE